MNTFIRLTRSVLLSLCLLGLALAHIASAATTWTGAAGDGLWNTPGNWSSGLPDSSDDVTIGGTATVTVNADAVAARINLAATAGDNVTLEINAPLTFYDRYSGLTWGAAGATAVVNINSGGVLDGGGGADGSRVKGNAVFNVNTGGVLRGIYRFQTGNNFIVNINGGRWVPIGQGLGIGFCLLNNNTDVVGSDGVVELLCTANDQNVMPISQDSVTCQMANLTFQFRIAPGYTPQVGDSFDFMNLNIVGFADIGDGSNITNISADGFWEFEYDTSQWNPGNNKGVLTFTDVKAVPEPFAGAFAALIIAAAIGVRDSGFRSGTWKS